MLWVYKKALKRIICGPGQVPEFLENNSEGKNEPLEFEAGFSCRLDDAIPVFW